MKLNAAIRLKASLVTACLDGTYEGTQTGNIVSWIGKTKDGKPAIFKEKVDVGVRGYNCPTHIVITDGKIKTLH